MADAALPDAGGVVALDSGLGESRMTIGSHVLTIERRAGGGLLRLVAADGTLPLEITISKAGAVLRLGTGLAVSVEGPLAISADALSIHAREGIDLQSGGGISVRAAGDLVSEAEAQTITARLGNVDVKANDDVVLRGERIKLNC